jgi:HAD superfamily hydrolase (TIGR01509 family)
MEMEPGIGAMLDDLDRRGPRYGILSNSVFTEATLRAELRRAGVEARFAFVMATADYGMQKPHPEIYMTAAAKLGQPAERVLFIGDSLHCDVAGPQKVGMPAAWYNPGRIPRDEDATPDFELHAWEELADLLDGIAEENGD